MQLTLIRWACLFSGSLICFAGNPVKGCVFLSIWAGIGLYQLKTGKF